MDPLSIATLAFTAVKILGPAIEALAIACYDGGSVFETLDELRVDTIATSILLQEIGGTLNDPAFVRGVEDVQRGTHMLDGLERHLQVCHAEIENLRDLLDELGWDRSTNRLKQSILQFRLNRRTEEITRLKQRFQHHNDSIQTSMTLLQLCKQMQTADWLKTQFTNQTNLLSSTHQATARRNESQAAETKAQFADLKNEIRGLQSLLQKLPQQIKEQEGNAMDEEETRLLGDMQDTHMASVKLQRRATMRLQALTTLMEDTPNPGPRIVSRKKPPPVPSRRPVAPSKPPSTDTESLRSHAIQSARLSRQSVPRLSVLNDSLQRDLSALSSQDLDAALESALALAWKHCMESNKPLSDGVILHIGDLLVSAGKSAWAERPRTYIVLRMIDEVKAMDEFIFEGYKDIHLPYTDKTLPSCLKSPSSRHDFLEKQRQVLSPRSADLVQGGRHHHLDKCTDAYFVSIERLGRGGFSVVDRVRSPLTLQEYARKRIDRTNKSASSRKALEFLENEMRVLKNLSHLHLVKFVGSYTDRKHIGIIMEPVADTDLRRYLSKRTWSSDELAILRSFVGCLSSALAYLHQQKCRHKDIKPPNILIKGRKVLIADFGLSLDWSELGSDTTADRPEAYTETYAAPEVGNRQPRKSASDIWSMGCIFLEIATILAGENPEARTEFFQSQGSHDLAYWCNTEAVDSWNSRLIRKSKSDVTLLEWTRWMMRPDPDCRPTADVLASRVHTTEIPGLRYSGSCCVEDPASDDDSWEGSVFSDENTEPTTALTELTDISSGSSQPYSARLEAPFASGDLSRISKDAAACVMRKRKPVPAEGSSRRLEDSSIRPVPSITVKANHSSGLLAQAPRAISYDGVTFATQPWVAASLPQTTEGSPTPRSANARRRKHFQHQFRDTSSSADLTLSAHSSKDVPSLMKSNSRNVHTSVETAERCPHKSPTPLEEAFVQSHENFEHLILITRNEDPAWRDYLTPLLHSGFRDTKGFNLLHVASKFKDESLSRDVVELVLQKTPGASKEINLFGNSALHFAAVNNRGSLLSFLLQRGADPTVANIRGQTPLHIAVREQNIQAVKELVRRLPEEVICARDDVGQTPLHLACHVKTPVELMTDLLVAGAHPNIPDRHGRTPIELSLNFDRPEVTDLLLAHSYRNIADFNLPPPYQPALSSRSSTGKHFAECDCQVCLMLLAVSELRADESAFKLCTCQHHLSILCQDTMSQSDIVKKTFATCNCRGCELGRQRNAATPLCTRHSEVERDLDKPSEQPAIRRTLADAQILPYPGHQYYDDLFDVELGKKHDGLSLQDITVMAISAFEEAGFRKKASYRNNPDKVLSWVISNCHHLQFAWRMVEMLLDSGAHADTTDTSGWTALHAAARHGNAALANLLIERGATIEIPRQAVLAQNAYYTPARYALWFNHPIVLRQLLRAGANPDDQSVYQKRTLLHEAVYDYDRCGEHIPMLLAHGASLDAQDVNENKALNLASLHGHVRAASMLLDAGADVDAEGKNKARPLAMALKNGHTEMVMLLLGRDANYHAPCDNMPCALFLAVAEGHVDVVKTLLRHYSSASDMHRQDSNGRGILHILSNSSVGNVLENIDVLVEYGADVHQKDNSGSTPLHEAARIGNATMIERLLHYGAVSNALNYAGKSPLDLAQAMRHKESVELLGGSLEIKNKRWFSGSKMFKLTA